MKTPAAPAPAVDDDAPTLRIHTDPAEIDAARWNALLATQPAPSPFMRHEYLHALHASGSASADTGWAAAFATLWRGAQLLAACPLYVKNHSYGEYVFDWAWAHAYEEHGLAYYPKAVVAVPFTPVPGSRLLAIDPPSRALLVQGLLQWCRQMALSSLHLLFADEADIEAAEQAGLMLRSTVQFHWKNVAPTLPAARGSLPPEGALAAFGRPGGGSAMAPTLPASRGSLPPEGALAALGRPGGGSVAPADTTAETRRYRDFEDFLADLSQDKRKKIRQERRKVRDAGVGFRWARGREIGAADWDFFYRCYARTYREHGNPPYLTRDFFARQAEAMPETWLLFTAERAGRPIATSLIALGHDGPQPLAATTGAPPPPTVAYGRYWGALERVDCLHFEACYYQPIEWCIAHGVHRFEGGAQGEHKMARALMPVPTRSAHWLAHPAFADAVERFLAREGAGVTNYLEALEARSPFRAPTR